MDRQAAALFGGIVAVGLGPAVWLGGTLFRVDPAPRNPVPVMTELPTVAPTESRTTPGATPDPLPTEPTGPYRGGPDWYPSGGPTFVPDPVDPLPEPSESAAPSGSPSPGETPPPATPDPGTEPPSRPWPAVPWPADPWSDHPGPDRPGPGWRTQVDRLHPYM
ncbi:hypothetical protein GCM10027280_32330 [Micromonospora polyrhachis]|uniref:Uncharacterized protein n=1 Tax=Micromonospora polyrhachis TaxID=1282883 RepID=A0A7W7WR01_9ACTN|nr:hypothetical protein [Micromonospora polyrhachis]MBB4960826.1 hypothetical protein [Micromonospora polyrhachis]